VRVLRVTPLTAELWDGPASKAVAAFEFVKARLTGEESNLGEYRKVIVDPRRCRWLAEQWSRPKNFAPRRAAAVEQVWAPYGCRR
jgi:hypothetical protein